jgi:enoyl-CoA hydratase/carnithine racemase/carbon monoxide dehydrogenase subunit G
MEMIGEVRIAAPRQVIWDALNEPGVLRACIPGCDALDKTSETEFTATVTSKVGPIKAKFAGKVTLSDIRPPQSYTLSGEGQGGMAGFAKAEIKVTLEALEEQVTLLRYGVNANVGGKLAQLGARLIDATARKMADDFFEKFTVEVDKLVASEVKYTSAVTGDDASLANILLGTPPAAIPSPAPVLEAAEANASTAPSHAANVSELPALEGSGAAAAAPAATSSTALPLDLVRVLTEQQIKVWISDEVAVVTLNRPANRNSMTYAMWRAMPSVFASLAANPEVRVVVLTGAGDDFCAGADITEFAELRASVEQGTDYEVAVDACCDAIANIGKPTIAVIKGYCLGGGAHLAMSCDFRYAADSATFGIPAARLSIIYGVGGTKKLLALVGLTRAKRILYGGERFDAIEALRIGFVDHVPGRPTNSDGWIGKLFGSASRPATATDPMADARAFARSLAGNAPLTIAGAKTILNGLSMGPGSLNAHQATRLIAAAVGSHDYQEGRTAFVEKRAPAFKGH